MSNIAITRRGVALAGFAAVAAAALSGCNTTQTGVVGGQTAPPPAVSGYRISNIAVDTTPLLARSGNPTAQWVQEALPGALAKAFAAHMAPGDPNGETLSVRIDSVYLGGGGPADADRMRGEATLGARHTTLRATSTWWPSPSDQALWEQSFHNRVQALAQSYAGWLARKWRH